MIDDATVLALTPLVTALVEGAKKAGLKDDHAGPAALIFAFALVSLAVDDYTSRAAALTAIATGLSAAGLYSQLSHYLRREDEHAATQRPDA